MRRLRLAIRAVDWAGFDGCERELSPSIGGNATETEEWSCIILRAGVFGERRLFRGQVSQSALVAR